MNDEFGEIWRKAIVA